MKTGGEKEKRNYDGDTPSDIPSEKLIKVPSRHSGKEIRESGKNSTAKDAKIGSRHTTR